jgi:hypothetical protein
MIVDAELGQKTSIGRNRSNIGKTLMRKCLFGQEHFASTKSNKRSSESLKYGKVLSMPLS